MGKVYIEREDKKYVVIENKKVIAEAKTQAKAIEKAREKRPEETILVERVRDTDKGSRDKWRKP